MTSLQKQLAAIAASASHELDLKAQKSAYSKSLLFEPLVASNQSLETLFQICREGFEELCGIDPRFVAYQRTLFNVQSIKEERERMTFKESEDLNNVIVEFLTLVGPKLLLKPAMKSVEWLVRKFRIHDHNTVATVFTFLPYHMTSIFPTLLSILPKTLDPSLRFLYPYINSLSNPPRSAIIYNSIHNQNFFKRFNEFVISVCKAKATYHTLLSFWASVVTQTIDGILNSSLSGRLNIQRQREEDVLSLILPILEEALSQKKSHELILGCYMIIVVLCNKATLDDSVIDALISAVSQSWTSETCDAGLGCIALLSEQKEHLALPSITLKNLSRVRNLGERMETLREFQSVQKLCVGTIAGLIDRATTTNSLENIELVSDLARRNLVSSNLLELLRNSISQKYNALAPQLLGQLLSSIGEIAVASPMEKPTNITSMGLLTAQHEIEPSSTTNMDLEPNDSDPQTNASVTSFANILAGFEGKSFADIPKATFNEIETAFYHFISKGSANIGSLALEIRNHFQPDQSLEIRFLAFLLTFINGNRPVQNMNSALKLLSEYLKLMQPTKFKICEALLPYALVSLSHPFRHVRQHGGDLLILLNDFQKTELKNSGNTFSSIDIFHGLADHYSSISSDDLEKFIGLYLIPELEECIADKNHIALVMRSSLDDHGRSDRDESGQALKRLKSSLRKRIFEHLMAFVNHSPLPLVRLRLLSILNQIDRVAHQYRSQLLKHTFTSLTSKPFAFPPPDGQDTSDSKEMQLEICNIIHPRDTDSVEALLSIISDEKYLTRPMLQAACFTRLGKISEQMKSPTKDRVAQFLLKFSTEPHASAAAQFCQDESVQLLRTLHLSSSCLEEVVDACVKDLKSLKALNFAAKRRRIDNGSFVENTNGSDETTVALTKTTLTLELLYTSTSESSLALFHSVFKLLQALQDYRSQTFSDLGYLQSLTLSVLSSQWEKISPLKSNSLDHSIVRADLLVDCARNSTNNQTRSSAILLLAQLAKRIPQTVLQSLMPIFTLMSTTTAQQGDDFSAHVVDQTIQTVIPLLARAIRDQRKELIPATAEILLSFAAAFDHIPTHRRFRLFSLLASSLGPDESLFAIIATLVDRYPSSKEVEHFSTKLVRHFSPVECLKTVTNYLDLGLEYFEKHPQLYNTLIRGDSGGKRHFTSIENLLSVLPTILSDPILRTSFTQANEDNPENAIHSQLLSEILERVLRLSTKVSESISFRPLCSQLLESMLELFPFTQFISSVELLLKSSDDEICKSLLKTLEVRISSDTFSSKAANDGAVQLLPHLINILGDPTRINLTQNVIACIDQICNKCGKLDIPMTLRAAEAVAGDYGIKASNHVVQTLSMHCLASCVGVLQNEFIPLLQPVWNIACKCLLYSTSLEGSDIRLYNASHTLLCALVTQLSFLITKELFCSLLEISYIAASRSSSRELDESRRQLYRHAAFKLEPKVLFSSLSAAWHPAIEHEIQAVRDFLFLLKGAIANQTKSVINQNSSPLFALFVNAFDFRRMVRSGDISTSYETQEIEHVEKAIIEALMVMILKINDATLRPFFIQLVDWCHSSLSKNDPTGRCLRWITFTKFLTSLSEKLKSIVTVYFSYPLDQFAEILRAQTVESDDQELLLHSVIKALTSAFKYDQDDFWQNPSHFDMVMAPLLELIGTRLSTEVKTNVLPAVTELAATAASPEHHKVLNTAILKLLRSDSIQTRLSAVKCQQLLTERLGDEWLANLPEMLPIINELQEDDDESVERETHRWIKSIEDILGESLNAMLQ